MNASGAAQAGYDFVSRHATEEEYEEYLEQRGKGTEYIRPSLRVRRRFVRAYPSIKEWLAAPLDERVGRIVTKGHGTPTEVDLAGEMTSVLNRKARPYIMYLATAGLVAMDWEWILAVPRLDVWRHLLAHARLEEGLEQLVGEAQALGYTHRSAEGGLRWAVSRIYMHTLDSDIGNIGEYQIQELEEAMSSFADREDRDLYFGSEEGYRRWAKDRGCQVHLLRVVLYHRGQIDAEPRKRWTTQEEWPALKPLMQKAIDHYLAARRLASTPGTVARIEQGLRKFSEWLEDAYPEVESFSEIDREHVVDYAEALMEIPNEFTGRPLAARTRRRALSSLSVFFRDTADWDWEDVPGRPLLVDGDMPKDIDSIPRYVPEHELSRLMEAVKELECPYQRAAVLIARWSGARRDEITRLEIECLDHYPDGTPRLRIPPGKTKQERIVPLNEEAAGEIRALQQVRRGEKTRGFRDELTGTVTRRLFVRYGKSCSSTYLFEIPLKKVCQAAGLVDEQGKPTVTAHRFRHTVGKQLTDKGARMRTVMGVLGHDSARMSLVYAQISDAEVLKDYQGALGTDATLAGPLVETLKNRELPPDEVEWIKQNYLHNELELGYCLRLPQEGQCECDLFFNCARFMTTSEYAPRLRARRQTELGLIDAAVSNGWQREVERHQCKVRRIELLLEDLGEQVEG